MINVIIKLSELEWKYIRDERDYEDIARYEIKPVQRNDLPIETEIRIECNWKILEDKKRLTEDDRTPIKTLINNALFGAYGRRPKHYMACVFKDLTGQNTKYPLEFLGKVYYNGNA